MGVLRDPSPTPSFCEDEPEDTAQEPIEEVPTPAGKPHPEPFRFTWLSKSPYIHSLSSDDEWPCSKSPDQQMCYCIHIKVMLGGRGGDQPPPSQAWNGLLVANMLQDGLNQWITEVVVIAPGEAILCFGRCSHKEGLPYGSARDVGFCLTGPLNWAGRRAHLEATAITVKEGQSATAVMEKRTKAWGPGCSHRLERKSWPPAHASWVDNWIQGLGEEESDEDLRADDSHTQWVITHSKWCRRQRVQGFPEALQEAHLPWGAKAQTWGVFEAPLNPWCWECPAIVTDQNRWGRGLRVKVNLPVFKDKKTKDAVTYCSWWWDVAIYCHLGWDDWHLLPYVFQSLQGFTGDLGRSLGKDATLSSVLQMLDEHYGVVKTSDALSKEFYGWS